MAAQKPPKLLGEGSSPSTPAITSFTGAYRFLSNFWPCSIPMRWWPTPTEDYTALSVEHGYQACKAKNKEDFVRILVAPTPAAAKRIARTVELRAGWDILKLGLMTKLVRHKFLSNEELRMSLAATYPAELIEGNWWGDRYWGVCGGKGENHLGKILMDVRLDACGYGCSSSLPHPLS